MTTATLPPMPARALRPRDVLLIDDHRVFTDVLSFALDAQPDLRCVATAHGLHEGLAKAAEHHFDVAIVDLHLPDGAGLTAIGRLRALRPEAQLIVLTGDTHPQMSAAAYQAGADAFVAKDDALQSVLRVIRDQPTAAPPPAKSEPRLTPREREVLALLATGADARQIARALRLSLHTVRDHIKAILGKLRVHSQHAAVAAATQLGLIAETGRP